MYIMIPNESHGKDILQIYNFVPFHIKPTNALKMYIILNKISKTWA